MNIRNTSLLIGTILTFLAMFMSNPVLASTCDVDVYGLNVEGNRIVGYVQNAGTGVELIEYGFYVNDNTVRTGSFELDPSQARRIEHTYSFGHGEYSIELTAEAECGSDDNETIIHNILEPFMCQNPFGFEGQDYCDYTHTRYMECRNSGWTVVDVNEGEYCYNCNACGDDVCNCGETSSTCWSDCGNICTPGYMDNWRCNGDWKQRMYRNSDCDYEWKDWERCSDDCVDGQCVSDHCYSGWKCYDYNRKGYQYSDCTWSSLTYCPNGCSNGQCIGGGYDGDCDVSIVEFDYINQVAEGSPAWVKFAVKNTGDHREKIIVTLYIDGSRWGSQKFDMISGSRESNSFNFYINKGTHSIRLEAEADCDSEDIKYATIVVQGPDVQAQACNYNGVCEYGENYNTCPHDCEKPEPVPAFSTSVDIHPASLDIEIYTAGTVSIDITSAKEQTFTIIVSGVEVDWVEYPSSVDADIGEKRVYLYITPQESGTHSLDITVRAESEGNEFRHPVSFYVSPREVEISGMTGFLVGATSNLALIVLGVVVLAVVVIYVGYKRIRPDEDFSGPEPEAGIDAGPDMGSALGPETEPKNI